MIESFDNWDSVTSYHSAEDIRKYKDAYKAIYYLLSIEKANK